MDVKSACLGVLACGDATGYEIRKQFEEGPFGHFFHAGFGSIYPALNRLQTEGLVSCMSLTQDRRPDKKIYTITAKGERTLQNVLMEAPDIDKVRSDFMFIVFFGERLPADWLEKVIDQRIAWYRGVLDTMCQDTEHHATPGQKFAHGFGVEIYRTAADYLENHKAELITAARKDSAA